MEAWLVMNGAHSPVADATLMIQLPEAGETAFKETDLLGASLNFLENATPLLAHLTVFSNKRAGSARSRHVSRWCKKHGEQQSSNILHNHDFCAAWLCSQPCHG
jgi:hypothetical protein